MNLRTDVLEKDTRPRYWYFFNYAFQTNSGTGEGMCELAYVGKKISDMSHIRETANYILEDNNKQTGSEKWKSVIIRNFILLREEHTDGIECGEKETSSKDDPKVSEGS